MDRHKVEVKCDEPRFDEMACLTKDKIKELAEILTKARMPREDKNAMLKIVNEILERK